MFNHVQLFRKKKSFDLSFCLRLVTKLLKNCLIKGEFYIRLEGPSDQATIH